MEGERIKIGLQLYSVREDCARDLPGTLETVSGMGYEGVEFAGFHNYDAKEIKAILEENNLACCGSHTPQDDLSGENLRRAAEFNLVLGNEFLIVPGLPPGMRGALEAWRNAAEFLNGVSENLKPFGLRTGYHNHFIEFEPVGGRIPWEVIAENTNSGVVLQMDTGNALRAGVKPEDYIEKYPGRARTVHLKEYSKTDDRALAGEGSVNWERVFEVCGNDPSILWYIVEQESYPYTPLECVERCLRNLTAIMYRKS